MAGHTAGMLLALIGLVHAASTAPSDLVTAATAKLDAGDDPAVVLDGVGDVLVNPAGADAPTQMKLWTVVAKAEQRLGSGESQHLLLAYDATQRCLAVPVYEGDQPLRDACTALAEELSTAKTVYEALTTPLPPTLLFLAYRADAAKQLDRAHAYAAAVTAQAPKVADGWYLAGITRFNQAVASQGKVSGDKIGAMLKEARVDFEKAWELDPKNAAALDALIPLCNVLHDSAAAAKYTAARAALVTP